MAEAPLPAEIVHVCPGRVRLRLPAARGRPEVLDGIRTGLSQLPRIDDVVVNPGTGSVLVRGTVALEDLAAHSLRHGLFEIVAALPEMTPLIDDLLDQVGAVDVRLRRLTRGRFDLASTALLTFTGLALVQMMRGRVAAPALTMLWYAVGAVAMARAGRGGRVPLT